MGQFETLTKELYEPDINPILARRHLQQAKESVGSTYHAAQVFGNPYPRPPTRTFWDTSLKGTNTIAWYLDPQEVKQEYPMEGLAIEREIGSEPIVAYNPRLLRSRNKNFIKAVDAHEKAHGGQQGKMKLKKIGAVTRYGPVPLGEMLIEGGVEWALDRYSEKSGVMPPSRYMDQMNGGLSLYGIYREFAHELEGRQNGILRQVYRAAARAGPRDVVRHLETVPGIGEMVDK